MPNRQSNRQNATTPAQGGGGLGAPGTTGAYGARDPLGAPGSTGASVTNTDAPGYNPTAYSTGVGGQQQLHRPTAESGGQEQLHRPGGGTGTGLGYTYGTAASMGPTPTAAGYHAGVHVPVTTGVSHQYETVDVYDIGDFGRGGGGGYDTGKIGERSHGGIGGERGDRGERHEMTEPIEDPGGVEGGYDFVEMTGDRTRGVGDKIEDQAGGGYGTAGVRERNRDDQRRV